MYFSTIVRQIILIRTIMLGVAPTELVPLNTVFSHQEGRGDTTTHIDQRNTKLVFGNRIVSTCILMRSIGCETTS